MASPNLPEFDGTTRRIILAAGITQVNVESDLYSQWKEWFKIGDNAKFPPAFRTVGGDPLTPGINAGAYFFIQNQYGWRIRPPEEDTTIFIEGNLAPEDSTDAIATPTLGGYTVLLLGLQPITQSVAELLGIQQSALFNGQVVIDFNSLNSGTSWPNGTLTQPVNNTSDAFDIATREGITKIAFRNGTLNIPQAVPGWVFIGLGPNSESTLNMNGQDVTNCLFADLTLTGTALASSPGQTVGGSRLRFDNAFNIRGEFHDSGVLNTFTFIDGSTVLHFAHSQLPGVGKPVFNFNGTAAQVSIRAYDGGGDFVNCTDAAATMTMDCSSGAPRVNASCTAGQFVFRGVGDLTDNNGGTSVVKDGWVDGKDVKLIKAMVSGNAVVSLDDLTVTVYDPDVVGSPQTVLAVFDISSDGRVRTRTL